MNILFSFVMTERFQYADINVFANNMEPALRYYDFLSIVLGRYEEVNKGIVEIQEEERKLMSANAGISRVTPEQGRLMVESSRLTTLVHLEIESFYMFAKVLLDNIARFLYVYFGLERGVGLKSHNDLAKHYEKYFKAKRLAIPEGLPESITLLKDSICDYRDKEISHELSLRRTRATGWSGSGGARIVGGVTQPLKDGWVMKFSVGKGDLTLPRKDDSIATSAELPQLMEAINAYIGQVKNLIESNRIKSRFKLKSQPES